ncbi:YaaL family protein [Eupransor demetentiae]|uniref:Uncharacterized protein n=1 Tax=Eupransor demetentiae TaxID=3109584 RepID=A0ABM9N5F5_9LACO|nr:hypothetical protein R54876_GBNLAHCA_00953 [Lactobacillaceae bacterium LMG 33000]
MAKKKAQINLKREYDNILLYEIDQLKQDLVAAQQSETALIDSRVNGHLVEAQTALARAKFSYVYREARRRRTMGNMPNVWLQEDF